MDFLTFGDELRRGCRERGIPFDVVLHVEDRFRGVGKLNDGHLAGALIAAETLAHVQTTPSETGGRVFETAVTPAQLAAAPTVEAAIAPAVESVRHTLFGSGAAPWSLETYSKAVEWLEAAAEDQQHAEPSVDWAEVRRLEHELRKMVGAEHRVRLQRTSLMLRYAKPGGGVRGLSVGHGSRLHPLAKLAADVRDGAGISTAQTVAHVLCGTPLRLPRVSSEQTEHMRTLSDGTRLARSAVTVTFNTPDLSFAELRALYRELSRDWGRHPPEDSDADPREGRHRFTPADAELLLAVQRAGGVPPRAYARRGFWQRLVAELDTDVKPETLARRWRRLEVKRVAAPVTWQRPTDKENDNA